MTQFSTEADLEQVWVLSYFFHRDLSRLRSSLLAFLTAVSRLGLGWFPYDRVDRYRKSERSLPLLVNLQSLISVIPFS